MNIENLNHYSFFIIHLKRESYMLIFILPFVITIALFIILYLKVRSLEKRVNRLTLNNKNKKGIDRKNSNNI